jgi:hypothetical protein
MQNSLYHGKQEAEQEVTETCQDNNRLEEKTLTRPQLP